MAAPDSTFIGNYELFDLRLISPQGGEVELDTEFGSIQIFEDIKQPFSTAVVTFNDTIGLFEALPIVGEETLRVGFYNKDIEELRFLDDFRVYHADQTEISERKILVNLYCVSREKLTNDSTLCGRSFKNLRYSDMVRTIFREFLQNDFGGANIDQTRSLHNFIASGNLKPFEAVNQIANRSLSLEAGVPDMYFYFSRLRTGQNTQPRLFFKSLSQLINQPSAVRYEIQTGNKPTDSPEEDNANYNNVIQSYEYKSRFDILKSLNQGMYGNILLRYNIVTGQFEYNSVEYSSYNRSALTGNAKLNTTNLDVIDRPTSLLKFHHENDTSDGFTRSNNIDEVIPPRLLIQGELDVYGLKIIVPGDQRRTVGETIDIDFPSYIYLEPEDEKRKELDKYIRGKYLITQVKHEVSATEFKTHITCIKNAFFSQIEINPRLRESLNAS